MKKRNSILAITILILEILLLSACSNRDNASHTDFTKPETGTFTDPRDGHIYKTVKVGDQWIMAENLAYKPEKGQYWVYDDDESNIEIFGYLYDWETAMIIVPEGWHLPTRDEWIDLTKTLGAKRNTFRWLKIVYPKLLVGGSSGVDMLLGGMRTCDGNYVGYGDKARFWTSTGSDSEKTAYGLNKNREGQPHGLIGNTDPIAYNNGYTRPCLGCNVRFFKD